MAVGALGQVHISVTDVGASVAFYRDVIPVKELVVRVYGMRQLNVIDPDGYGLCFQYPANKAEPQS